MSEMCRKVEEQLAAIVDGDAEAIAEVADHLAGCERCRDLRFEAEGVARRVAGAGADFEEAQPPKSAPREARRRVRSRLAWTAVALVAAGGLVAVGVSGGPGPAAVPKKEGHQARLGKIARAAEGDGGVSVAGRKAGEGAVVKIGDNVRTDERTRVRVELEDGSSLVLNHATEVVIEGDREVRLVSGEVAADVAHLEGRSAFIHVPLGKVEVLGTQFLLAATREAASVRVTRGLVKLEGAHGEVEVHPGEEGILEKGGKPEVAPAVDLAASVGWSELDPDPAATEAAAPGLGELRAKKPGEARDRERPLTLARHKVLVRIAGNVARTEVEEVFQNDSRDVLEGIYRFPLPADARIDRLALEVDGKLEEGAFVERERAAGIWRGVIHHATPKDQREPAQELVWVPGPWRDPALLEWQKGGRFELKIFPIPARGARRVILAYTQVVEPFARGRRYVYPLAHSADRSTRVGHFELDVRVAGAAEARAHGYPMPAGRDGDTTVLSLAQDDFLPAGDVIVDYDPAGGEAPVRYWTFRGDVAVPGGDPKGAGKKTDPAYLEAQRQVAADQRPFVLFAVRPRLPLRTETRPRDLVLVVDASQSMVGERYGRAGRLAQAIVAQMDRRDRFVVLACDVDCREMDGTPRAPSAQAAQDVLGWLQGIRPAGASDLARALARANRSAEGRETHVLYIGDGLASVGPRRAAALAGETAELAARSGVRFTTVGIGADADALALAAVARAGGGQYVPYVPGERVAQAALAVLETTFGASLRDVSIELPAGVTEVAPAELPTLRAGQELLVAGRFTGEPKGEIVLKGSLGGRPWSDRWPVSLTASTAAGNAFVPRLWAAQTIDQLDLAGHGEDTPRIVGLSKAFGVMSRHTSLLVLESEAMFRAFGIDRSRPILDFSGDQPMEVGEASGLADGHEPDADLDEGIAGKRDANKGGSLASLSDPYGGVMGRGAGGGGSAEKTASTAPAAADKAEMERPEPAPKPAPVATPPPATRPEAKRKAMPLPEPPMDELSDARFRRPGRWMRKVWYSVGQVQGYAGPSSAEERGVDAAERALAGAPDSRDRHRALALALARAGDLERAEEITEAWLSRDRLDAEALATLADVIARQGRRDEGLRLLSGIVDLHPDDAGLQERLARAYERAAMADRACAHRVALAEIAPGDARAVGAAVRCQRALGRETAAARVLDMLADAALRLRAEQQASAPAPLPSVNGALVVDASWRAPSDLDVSIVTPQGARLSWTGGRAGVAAASVAETGRERLALRACGRGTWLIEVARTRPGDTTPVSGSLRIRVHGTERTVPFRLDSEREVVARVDVTRQFRLEPVN